MDNSLDLFKPLTRDQRQELCRQAWIRNKCIGTIVAPTGLGKTRIALNCIKTILSRYSNFRILIVVPTETLKTQWQQQLDEWGFAFNCEVQIINTVIKHDWKCNILVIDEAHRLGADCFQQVFTKVKYKYILGLTATFERLDGKEEIISKHCPVIDTISPEEALLNGWVSQYTEYQVLINVDDIEEYKRLDREFNSHFEYFSCNFDLVNKCLGKGGFKFRAALRDKLCTTSDKTIRSNVLASITNHAMKTMQFMQQRKAFINNHPKKLEIARKIIEARKDKKIILFANNINMAESVGIGQTYSGRDSKKKGRTTIEEFSKAETGVLCTCQKANEGLDVQGLSVAIIIGTDSSKTKAVQRKGRVIRLEPGKQAEIFNIIINNTAETKWFANAHEKSKFVTIDESNLDKVLAGEEYETYKKPVQKLTFRF